MLGHKRRVRHVYRTAVSTVWFYVAAERKRGVATATELELIEQVDHLRLMKKSSIRLPMPRP